MRLHVVDVETEDDIDLLANIEGEKVEVALLLIVQLKELLAVCEAI